MNTRKRDTFARATPHEIATAKKIARNTWRYNRDDGTEVIRLHNTDIVATKDGQTTFTSGGFRTITTKDRMNLNGQGFRIYSVKGAWHVARGEQVAHFFEGITLPRDFANAEKLATEAKAEKELNASIRKFCSLLLDESKPIPRPDTGDCWYCSMFDRATPAEQRGQPGDRTGGKVRNAEHLLEHIREGYMHGSLILNAIRWAGYGDAFVHLTFSDPSFFHGDRRRLATIVRRYLKYQLGAGEAR